MNRLVCAWCKRELRAGSLPISHGICPSCQTAQLADLEQAQVPPHTARDNVLVLLGIMLPAAILVGLVLTGAC